MLDLRSFLLDENTKPINGRTKEEGKKIRFYHILPVLFRIALERIKQ